MFDVTCLDKYGNTVTNLTQWDLNQTLYIENHGFTTAPQFHFCNKNSERALIVQSTIVDDMLQVVVPNILLTEPYTITAYVYLSEDNSGKTVEYVQIPVRQRPQPNNFEYEDNAVIIDVKELADEMRALNASMSSAEEARVKAENTRVANEKTRASNENARKTAETARVSAETARVNAENTRESNEGTRKSNEDTRKTAETARTTAESTRVSNENTRKSNESSRKTAETNRATAETARVDAEKNRVTAETTRSNAEQSRVDAETARVTAENKRISAETTRQSQETSRQTNTATAITNAERATERANHAAEACEGIIEGTGLIPSTEKGRANGVATLDENTLIPINQIPTTVGESGARNLIPYPYWETTHTDNGITWTDNGDGTVTANGTATTASGFYITPTTGTVFKKGTYKISGSENPSNSTYRIQFFNSDWSKYANEAETGIVTLDKDTAMQCRIHIASGITVENLTFRPMLEVGSIAHDFVPYHFGGAEDTQKFGGLLPSGYYQTNSTTVNASEVDCFSLPPGHYSTTTANGVSTAMHYPVDDTTNLAATIIVTGHYNESQARGYRVFDYSDNKGRRYYATEWWGNTPTWHDYTDATTLDGHEINEFVTNENLVVNPDFKIGGTSVADVTSSKLIASKWVTTSDTATIYSAEVTENGLHLSQSTVGSYCNVYQDLSVRESGTYTVSFLVDKPENVRQVGFSGATLDSGNNFGFTINGNVVTNTFAISNLTNTTKVYIQLKAAVCDFTIKWVKVERGAVATPYITPISATENTKASGFTVYTSVAQLGITSYHIPDIVKAMPANSMLIESNATSYSAATANNNLPNANGTIEIIKPRTDIGRTIVRYMTGINASKYGLYLCDLDETNWIINGWRHVGDGGNANTLDGHDSTYFTTRLVCFAGSDTNNTSGWYKVASKTLNKNDENDLLFSISSTYSHHFVGILYLHIRNSNGAMITPTIKWLTRYGYKEGDVRLVYTDTTWTLYVKLYASQYGRTKIEVLSDSTRVSGKSGITLHSSTAPETTEPDATMSSSDGGLVEGANKLNLSEAVGSATNPVYFNASGEPVKTTYTLGKSVPSTAVFTDTNNVAYGTCSTAAATATKVITISGNTSWKLEAGAIITVKFSATNTAQNPTFNVNSTGAKSVWYNTALITTSSLGYAGTANRPMQFVYDGTQYVFMGWALDNNTTYSNASLGCGYGTCSTAEATTEKAVTLSSYTLATGGFVAVKFTNAVPANATMNINSKGAKAIYYKGSAITANVIKAGDTATFVYNGTYYHVVSIDRDNNSDTKVTISANAPTSATNYYPTMHTETSGTTAVTANTNIKFQNMTGTTSVQGYNVLILGNETAKGTASNSYGVLRLFGDNTNYTQIKAGAVTANRTITLPNASGTLELTGHTQAANTITAGELGGEILANVTAAATLGNAQLRNIVIKDSVVEGAAAAETNGTIIYTRS